MSSVKYLTNSDRCPSLSQRLCSIKRPGFIQLHLISRISIQLSIPLVQANQSSKMKLFAYIVASAMALLLLMAPAMADDTTAAGGSTPAGSTTS
ncbi:hypothetical protein AVEN_184781-1 [Araneus ventricosus]|uniref:Uncharacterized protein n=1 Tax=Araneus ventricosus TaxID=182803 RepID=A0A4Y2PC39_ARAVE|nr:hypothetical protein AVEN_184781-1 [Araneus ventricosus]